MVDERVQNAPVRLAIDFGTSHTVAVVRRAGQQPRVLLFDGSPLLMSGVYAAPDGELHTGVDAERLAQVDPAGFDPHPKRSVDHEVVLLGRHELAPATLIGAVLHRVARAAAEAGAGPSVPAVLTCPADWGRRRRGVLLGAAAQAGLRIEALVDEPVAAATYCLETLDVAVGRSLVVFDFGGGTLDVAAVRREPAGLRVLATGGLDNLGGLDVDAALVGHLGQAVEARDPALWARLSNPADPAALRDRRAFWGEVRAAKEMLSRTVAAPVPLPGDAGALHLTRDELQRVAGPLVDRAVDETRRLLRDARIGRDELAGIFLVGGSSRMPLVATKLHERLGVAPAVPEQPELPVSFGALAAAEADAPPRPGPPAAEAPPRPAPPGGDGWAPRSPDPSGPTANGGVVEAGAGRTPAGRSNRLRVLAGVLAAVVLLGGGLMWWYAARHPAGGGDTGARDSPGATQGGPGANHSAPAPSAPAGFVPCGPGKLCPTTPICWGGPVIIAGNATAEQRDCGESHYSETYIAAYLPPDAVGVSYAKLQQRPDIKALCDVSVLVSRLRTPSGNGGWVWKAMPVAAGADKVVHCMGGRNQKDPLTASLFRTGP